MFKWALRFSYNNSIVRRLPLHPADKHLPVASLGLLRVDLAPVQLMRRRLHHLGDAGLIGKKNEAKTSALLRVWVNLHRDIFHFAKTEPTNQRSVFALKVCTHAWKYAFSDSTVVCLAKPPTNSLPSLPDVALISLPSAAVEVVSLIGHACESCLTSSLL